MRGSGRAARIDVRRVLALLLALAAGIALAALAASGAPAATATVPAMIAAKPPPAQLASQTLGGGATVQSGHLDASVALALDGVKQLDGQPVVADLSGPFARSGGGGVSADLTLALSAAGSHADIGIDLAGGAIYVGVGGRFHRIAGTGASSGGALATGASGLASLAQRLGIDPSSWLIDPHVVGTAEVGGVPTEHLTARIDVAKALGELAKAIVGGATGASSPLGATGASWLTSGLAAVESAITSAQLDLYTGIADHIVRRVEVAIAFTVPAALSARLDGLTGGSLDLDVTLTDVNRPETIVPPSNALTQSGLERRLERLARRFRPLARLARRFEVPTGAGGAVI